MTVGDLDWEGGKGAESKGKCVTTPEWQNILVVTEVKAYFQNNLSCKVKIKDNNHFM